MDSLTTASPDGADEYVFYRQGAWSWSIPYIAGMYALAVQVDPTITPDRFWSLALETGRTIELKHDGQTIPLGPILDPVALMDALEGLTKLTELNLNLNQISDITPLSNLTNLTILVLAANQIIR